MRISDWSSDVCSSDLLRGARPGAPPVRPATGLDQPALLTPAALARRRARAARHPGGDRETGVSVFQLVPERDAGPVYEIGRASCRGSGGQYVENSVVAVSLKNK